MPHYLQLGLVLLAGMGLGALYFGGLAWTVRRLVAGGGVLLTVGSFLLRAALLLAGFWLVAGRRAECWIACLIGFTAARILLSKMAFLSHAAPWALWLARREEPHASHH